MNLTAGIHISIFLKPIKIVFICNCLKARSKQVWNWYQMISLCLTLWPGAWTVKKSVGLFACRQNCLITLMYNAFHMIENKFSMPTMFYFYIADGKSCSIILMHFFYRVWKNIEKFRCLQSFISTLLMEKTVRWYCRIFPSAYGKI